MELTPITVTLVILLIILSILVIYFSIKIEKFSAPDVPEYDPKQVDENCMNYITNIKSWNLDYGLPEPTNEKEKKAREDRIKRRADIISLFTTMKSPMYSVFGQQYAYSDACVIPRPNIKSINMIEDTCILDGNVIKETDDDDGTSSIAEIKNYKKKYIQSDKIQLYTPEIFRNNTALNENDMKPNKGCIIRIKDDPNIFFDTIDRLGAISNFKTDNDIRLLEEEKVKAIREKIKAIEERRIALEERRIAIEERIFADNERQRVEIERNVALAQIEQDRIIIEAAKIYTAQLQETIVQDANTLTNTKADYDRQIGDLNNRISEAQNRINKALQLEQKLRKKIEDLTVKPTFYKDTDFRGASISLDEGEWDIGQLNAAGQRTGYGRVNDTISSVIVPKDYNVTIFTDAGFRGRQTTLTMPSCALGKKFRDKISSVKVVKLNKVD